MSDGKNKEPCMKYRPWKGQEPLCGNCAWLGTEHDITKEKSPEECELILDHTPAWCGDGFYCLKCMIPFAPETETASPKSPEWGDQVRKIVGEVLSPSEELELVIYKMENLVRQKLEKAVQEERAILRKKVEEMRGNHKYCDAPTNSTDNSHCCLFAEVHEGVLDKVLQILS